MKCSRISTRGEICYNSQTHKKIHEGPSSLEAAFCLRLRGPLFFAIIFLAPSHCFPPHPHFPLPFLHALHHKLLSQRRQPPSLVPSRRSHLHLLKLLEIARLLSNAEDAVFVAQLVDDRHEHRCVKQCWDSDLLLDVNVQTVDVVNLRVRLFLFKLNL